MGLQRILGSIRRGVRTAVSGGGSRREPPEEVFREKLLAGFWAVHGTEIDDVFPANSAERAKVRR